MSANRPLIMGPGGFPEVLPEGEFLAPDSIEQGANTALDGFRFWAENLDLPLISAGHALATVDTEGGVVLAVASGPQLPAVGLAQANMKTGFGGWVQVAGLFTLADWTLITGAVELVPNRYYFLNPVYPGRLTLTPPAGTGKIAQCVAKSVSKTTLSLRFDQPILL